MEKKSPVSLFELFPRFSYSLDTTFVNRTEHHMVYGLLDENMCSS